MTRRMRPPAFLPVALAHPVIAPVRGAGTALRGVRRLARGCRPPTILTTSKAPPAADQPAQRDWCRVHAVNVLWKRQTSPLDDPLEALSTSALHALDADRRPGDRRLPVEAAQARLDRWRQTQRGR